MDFWTPFVGSFIARVSKGRTIREFIIGVMFVPALICKFWFTVFGGTAIHLDLFQNADIAKQIATNGKEVGLFAMYSHLPLSGVLTKIGLCLITTFFVTSADSATFVVAMQTSNGSLSLSNRIKFTWVCINLHWTLK